MRIIAATVILVLDVVFLFGGILFTAFRIRDGRLLARLRRTPRMTAAQLREAGSLPRWVLVRGRVVGAPLVSAGFATSCLWYETEVRHTSDDQPYLRMMHEQRGPDRIALVDGSGEVLVPVGLLLGFRGPASVRHEYGRLGEAEPGSALYRIRAAGGLDTSIARKRDLHAGQMDVTEQALPADVVVTVLARPRRRGVLVTLARRDGAVSLDPPDDWAARVQAGLGAQVRAAAFFALVGLVLAAVGAGLLLIAG
jgi:hypothetical protein